LPSKVPPQSNNYINFGGLFTLTPPSLKISNENSDTDEIVYEELSKFKPDDQDHIDEIVYANLSEFKKDDQDHIDEIVYEELSKFKPYE
ncbi:MAG: hypothetical protein K1060chlam1_00706, partial [Candidatus Anoxychlamydiales bacterium]|nr:hypothetical protein [Candidatus Anoxychlamydiales bacterium]